MRAESRPSLLMRSAEASSKEGDIQPYVSTNMRRARCFSALSELSLAMRLLYADWRIMLSFKLPVVRRLAKISLFLACNCSIRRVARCTPHTC